MLSACLCFLSTLATILLRNSTGCLTLCCGCLGSVFLSRGDMGWSNSVIVAFPDHTHFIDILHSTNRSCLTIDSFKREVLPVVMR